MGRGARAAAAAGAGRAADEHDGPGVLIPPGDGGARRARVAVAALFAANGASFATVLPRYPLVKAELGLTNAEFGLAVAAYPLGALFSGLLGGVLVSRWGSARVAVACSGLLALNLVLVGAVPGRGPAAVFAVALLLGGSFDSLADIADNAHGLRVQREYGRSILNSLHGSWSIGAVAGGLAGSLAAGLSVPLLAHLGGAAVLLVATVAVASRFLLRGPDPDERGPATRSSSGRRTVPRVVVLALVALGLVGAMANLVEDAASTWGALYLDGLGAGAAVAGLGFVVLQAAQIVGRLTGDRWVTRYGDRSVARAGAVLVVLGAGGALLLPSTAATLIGFGAAGLGVATMIPAAMHAADDLPGLPPGVGLTAAGTILRLMLLASPPVVGLVADHVSLRVGLVVMPLAGVVVLLLSRFLEGRVVRT